MNFRVLLPILLNFYRDCTNGCILTRKRLRYRHDYYPLLKPRHGTASARLFGRSVFVQDVGCRRNRRAPQAFVFTVYWKLRTDGPPNADN